MSFDRFGQGVQVVASFQHRDQPAMAALSRYLLHDARHFRKAFGGDIHSSEGVFSMGVKSGGNHDKVRIKGKGLGCQDFFKRLQIVLITRAHRKRNIDSKTESFAASFAFRWEGGAMANLGTLPGGAGAVAEDINSAGQVVGMGQHNGQTRAFLSTPADGACCGFLALVIMACTMGGFHLIATGRNDN